MTIAPFTPGSYRTRETGTLLAQLREQSRVLERQMSTGQRSDSYSGLGFERRESLDLRERLSRIESYQMTITNVNLRLDTMMQGIEALDGIAVEMRKSLALGTTDTPDGFPLEFTTARTNLEFAVSIFNTEVNGRYLFGGRDDGNPPVIDYDALITGLQGAIAGAPDPTNPADIMNAVQTYFTGTTWQTANADTSTPARDSVTARVDDGLTVSVGALPNEPGFRGLLVALGALAATNAGTLTPAAQEELRNLAEAQLGGLNPQPHQVATELGFSQGTIGAARERQETMRTLMNESLAGIEGIDTEEVAVRLMTLQTRLQASYQTTATLSRLSLVNYL